jgi:hypothetical protein
LNSTQEIIDENVSNEASISVAHSTIQEATNDPITHDVALSG